MSASVQIDQNHNLKRTPLYNNHLAAGGKIVPFAGWELPVQYAGLIAEHNCVRTKAGLFDVSHMGEIFVSGAQAKAAISSMTCNDLSKLNDGKAQYNAIINSQGGVVDDIIVYQFNPTSFLICVNASNADIDFAWFLEHNRFDAQFVNRSAEFAQIALQGPSAAAIIAKLGAGGETISKLKPFWFAEVNLQGAKVIAARTGYTGEDGFEIFVAPEHVGKLWDELLAVGAEDGISPCGLGARDTLRLEACYPLHGHELGVDISAVESGLGWIVKPAKGEFIGREVLQAQLANGAPRSLVGFIIEESGIARHGDKVLTEQGALVGVVTSGTKTPTINKAIGMALVDSKFANPGSSVNIEVRGRQLKTTVVERPFYKRAK